MPETDPTRVDGDVPTYTVDDFADLSPSLRSYRKRTATSAVRIDGPFLCQTIHEGVVRCEDGWLAFDQAGYPYPIAAEEFDAIYAKPCECPGACMIASGEIALREGVFCQRGARGPE